MKKQLHLFGRSIAIILTVLLLFQTDFGFRSKITATAADTFTEGAFTYTISGGYAYVSECNSSYIASLGNKAVIPSKVNGYTVKGIADFKGNILVGMLAGTISGIVEQVILPNTCEYIGSYAFSGAAALSRIDIPAATTSIGNRAFNLCKTITVTIRNKNCKIADNAFDTNYTGTIYCYSGSTAETYARAHGFQYVLLDGGSGTPSTQTTAPAVVTSSIATRTTARTTTKKTVTTVTTRRTAATTRTTTKTTTTTTRRITTTTTTKFWAKDYSFDNTFTDTDMKNIIVGAQYECNPGDEINYPVYIYNNTGFSAAGMRLHTYIPVIEENGSVKRKSGEAASDMITVCVYNKESHTLGWGAMSHYYSTENGVLFFVPLKIPETAKLGTNYEITIDVDEWLDKNGNSIPVNIYNGRVHIHNSPDYIPAETALKTATGKSLAPALTTDLQTYLMGDINHDLRVTAKDALLVLYEYVNVILCQKESTLKGYEWLLADVDKNGEVRSEDSQLILYYYTETHLANYKGRKYSNISVPYTPENGETMPVYTTTKIVTTTTTTETTSALELNTKSITLTNGGQFTIKANKSSVSYRSNNPDVAIVSSSGVITAIGAGQAIITVFDAQSNAAQIKVTVNKVPATPANADWGNVNCTEGIDVADAVLAARFVAEDAGAIISAQGKINADVNHDGNITADDTILILRYIAKLVTLAELEP